jgi:integrase
LRQRAILEAVKGDPLEAAYALAFLGLREGEFLGIARSDLDVENMTLTIRHQISGSGRNATLVETKTASSVATIPVPAFVVDRLLSHLEQQDALRPVVPFGDSLVFMTKDGLAINGSWFMKHFQSLRSGRACRRCVSTTCVMERRACSSPQAHIRESSKNSFAMRPGAG